jgi:hypothetical protein
MNAVMELKKLSAASPESKEQAIEIEVEMTKTFLHAPILLIKPETGSLLSDFDCIPYLRLALSSLVSFPE